MKNDPSVYGKQPVDLWKTTRRFMKNDLSVYEKQPVALEKKISLHEMRYKLALFTSR